MRINLLIASSEWENICSLRGKNILFNEDSEHVIKNIIEVLIENVQNGKYI